MALTVEELQIVLSCDATTAQAVLDKMEATVKAYTDKFQKYFNNMGGKKNISVPALDTVVKDVEKQTKKLAKAGADWKKQYEKTWGESFEDSMKKAKANGYDGYVPSGKKYVGGDKNGRGGGMGYEYSKEFAKAAPTAKGSPDSKLIGLGKNALVELEAGLEKVNGISDVTRDKMERVAQAVRDFGNAYAETVTKQGNDSAAGKKAEQAYIRAVQAADQYSQKLDKIAAKEQETGTDSSEEKRVSMFERIAAAASAVKGKIASIGQAVKKSFQSSILGKFLKQLSRTIMRMTAMKLIRGTLDSIKQGLEILGKAGGTAGKAMNQVKAAGQSVKVALGVALMPVVKALAPVFYQVAQAVTAAGNAIARFFATLMGQSSYTAASISSSMDDVSSSYGGAGKAAKGALADFDEINLITKSSGGGGGGAGGDTGFSTVTEVLKPAQSELALALLEGDMKKVGEIIGKQLREWGEKLDEWWGKYFGNDNKYWKTAIEGLADFFVGLLRGMGFEQAASNLELFVAKVKAALGLVTEYYKAFLEAMDNSKLSIPFLTIEKWITGIKADFNSLARDIAATIQESPALRRIFGDQSAYIFRMDAETAAAKEKIAEIDNKIDELQKNGDEGVDIEAHVDHEKVDEYKKTLTTPWFVSEIDARMRNKVEQADVFANKSGVITNPTGGITLGLGILPRPAGTIELKSVFTNQGGVSQDANGLKATMNVGAAMASKVSAVPAFTDTGGVSQTKDGLSTKFNVRPEVEGGNTTVTALQSIITGFNEISGKAKKATLSVKMSGAKESAVTKMSSAISKFFDGSKTSTITINQGGASLTQIQNAADAIKNFPKSVTVQATIDVVNAAALKKALQDALTASAKITVNGKNAGSFKVNANNVQTMASGGIAYGITSAIIGEYAGASSNPEVVAPLSKLQGILESSGTVSKDTMTRDQANTMIQLLQRIERKEIEVKPSVGLGQVVQQSLGAYART